MLALVCSVYNSYNFYYLSLRTPPYIHTKPIREAEIEMVILIDGLFRMGLIWLSLFPHLVWSQLASYRRSRRLCLRVYHFFFSLPPCLFPPCVVKCISISCVLFHQQSSFIYSFYTLQHPQVVLPLQQQRQVQYYIIILIAKPSHWHGRTKRNSIIVSFECDFPSHTQRGKYTCTLAAL